MIRQVLREPLAHFLVLGSVVFALFHFAAVTGDTHEPRIVVTGGTLEQLVAGFSRTWHRPPDRKELDGLVEDHVREEVLYREALAIGLDKDDTVVRRRMRQKMEFLTADAGTLVEPGDHDLQEWLDRNPQRFRVEAAVSFSQIYFSPARHGEDASTAASQLLAQLSRPGEYAPFQELGDLTILPREMTAFAVGDVGRVFGDEFARQVAQLAPGRWTGPIQSSYGWHLVLVGKRTDEGPRPLAEVKEAVQREWYASRSKEIVDLTYRKLRSKYSVLIENSQSRATAKLPLGKIATATQQP